MADYAVLWTDTARRDLAEIVGYIAADGVDGALRVLERLERRAEGLRSQPQRGRAVPELRDLGVPQYRELIERPWRVIYRIEPGRVLVLAVLDGRRDLQSLLLERLTRV